ncbi:putative phosphoenolpyruvate synthase [Aricia agestis]|uniref:putative phosphoenolpyruvate synthase n=1 Tax=Aricia agestis TaxID=91739 RepID=UPI001C20A6DA|nr:putative phosphoenolpyruvate synthase [Aricia agestis]
MCFVMDVFDVLLQAGCFTAVVVTYLIIVRKQKVNAKNYRQPGWNYPLKLLVAKYAVKRWRSQLPTMELKDTPSTELMEGWDDITIKASAPNGVTVVLSIRKQCNRRNIAEVTVFVKLSDAIYQQHPETAVCMWTEVEGCWAAGGLKIQVLEPNNRLRILYNGLLTRVDDNTTQHLTFNFIWTSATSVIRHPHDWSENLASQTLALEPWRDTFWPQMLSKCDEGGGSWMQFGVVQGRVNSYNGDGTPDRSEYIRVRGVRERSWSQHRTLRRSINIVVAARDGTAVHIRASSYKNDFTQCVSGSVRLPNFMVKPLEDCDLDMSDFCETLEIVPENYTINVHAYKINFKIEMKINKDGGRVYHGAPHHFEDVFRTVSVSINGEIGTGVLYLGYEKAKRQPSVSITPEPTLRWLSAAEAGAVGYCVSLGDRAAACTDYVGGKGASLALLASIQEKEGYKVPPGFCLTVHAFKKQLKLNPKIKEAIAAIEAANENYEESNFKDKCQNAVDLIVSTEIASDVKADILSHLAELRRQAAEQGFGPELRFAVRSSAVGEDSEALSAAGQNDTILGCVSDDDVLSGAVRCWASMFAFTSACYRRQNGAACLCGGGVVVQVMCAGRAAGVMFTRHPERGHPGRVLVTANYGLGESVVSGAVEPDTYIVRRGPNDDLEVASIQLGSKAQRVVTSGNTVEFEDVPAAERTKPCLSVTEVLKLARLGVRQEMFWGAGRDIEWAITDNTIYLLQARPITSLERWTEEELLHEADCPIMSDDELLTFANVGEVLPKPLSPLGYDLTMIPLDVGMGKLVWKNGDGYYHTFMFTHNRCTIALYSTVYRRVPKKLDINIRMLELAIHGHEVADDDIIATALHRRQPRFYDRIVDLYEMVKVLLLSKRAMNNTIRDVNIMSIDTSSDDPLTLLDAIAATKKQITKFFHNHGLTTLASTYTQFLAMSILLEGRSDFTPVECNEVSMLLSSGDVLSAEVPNILARIARKIDGFRRLEEFRKQDPKNAMDWLKYNLPPVHDDVKQFLDDHGHRAIMEFDPLTKPWALVPEDFMRVLMHVQTTQQEPKPARTNDDVINSLKTPQKSSTRKFLRLIVPLCHRAVRHRESTKAHLILAVHKVRLAALNLGRVLVKRWYIPHPDLVFFFRVHELREYIQNRDTALLKKAVQRQQYFPKWERLRFAEINRGWVEPAPVAVTVFGAGVRLAGTTACSGEVVARACVVKDLSEIGQLRQGDVLLTHSTDIGWSPYFPLLAGIVTELGGLISHGAVIAREYGLPCIVGALGATDMFETGDMIRLSGTDGLIEKVNVEEEKVSEEKN